MSPILENQEIAKKPKHHLSRFFKKMRRSVRFGLVAMAALFIGWLVWFGVTHNPHFTLAKIEVVGSLKQLTVSDVVAAANIPSGTNIFSVSLQEIERNVLKLPWVANVSVRRQAPSILWIHVKEQKPFALLLTDKLYFVSDEGVVFKVVENEVTRDLPVLTGFRGEDSLTSAMQLIHFLENSSDFELFGISEVHYNEATGFSVVTLMGPIEVKLGKEDFEAKVERLKNIWPDVRERFGKVQGIDLDYSGKAFVKL